jgi:single-strand DNA-binding protein
VVKIFCLKLSTPNLHHQLFKNLYIMNNLRNRVLLIGRLGAQPETKTLANGSTLTRFNLATSESYKNDKGERITDTQWHNITTWGKVAELAAQLLDKGKEVVVEGKLVSRAYTDKDGVKRYVTEIVANDLLLVGAKAQ